MSAFGISAAMLCHTALASLGLSTLLATSAVAFDVVRLAGAAYLIVLGVQALRSRGKALGSSESVDVPAHAILRQGFFTNLFNPKVIVFFAAFLPQFVKPGHGHAMLQFFVFGATFTLVGLAMDLSIATASAGAGALIARSGGAARWLERVAGTVFVALGVRLLFERRA